MRRLVVIGFNESSRVASGEVIDIAGSVHEAEKIANKAIADEKFVYCEIFNAHKPCKRIGKKRPTENIITTIADVAKAEAKAKAEEEAKEVETSSENETGEGENETSTEAAEAENSGQSESSEPTSTDKAAEANSDTGKTEPASTEDKPAKPREEMTPAEKRLDTMAKNKAKGK